MIGEYLNHYRILSRIGGRGMGDVYAVQDTMSIGFSLPILPILLLIIVVLTWFFGWIVLVVVAALAVLMTAGTAVYDRLTHDTKCRYCNRIKEVFAAEKGIDIARITTKHEKDFADHMHTRVYIDGEKDVLVDIDYNGEILGVR